MTIDVTVLWRPTTWIYLSSMLETEAWFLIMADINDLDIEIHSCRVKARQQPTDEVKITFLGTKNNTPVRFGGTGTTIEDAIEDARVAVNARFPEAELPF